MIFHVYARFYCSLTALLLLFNRFCYTGSEITPALRVIYNGKLLREGSDYKVIYTNNTAAGKAKATVTGIGNFSGTTTAEFNITENGGETESPILTFFRNVASFISRVISFFISLFK